MIISRSFNDYSHRFNAFQARIIWSGLLKVLAWVWCVSISNVKSTSPTRRIHINVANRTCSALSSNLATSPRNSASSAPIWAFAVCNTWHNWLSGDLTVIEGYLADIDNYLTIIWQLFNNYLTIIWRLFDGNSQIIRWMWRVFDGYLTVFEGYLTSTSRSVDDQLKVIWRFVEV